MLTVLLSDEEKELLRRLAERELVDVSTLIRRLIRSLAKRHNVTTEEGH